MTVSVTVQHDGDPSCGYTVDLSHIEGGHPEYYKELENLLEVSIDNLIDLIKEQANLHAQKDGDYAEPGVPFQNLKEATQLGLTPVDAALVRASDKFRRVANLHRRQREGLGGPTEGNESKEDNERDAAAYMLIAIILEREARTP